MKRLKFLAVLVAILPILVALLIRAGGAHAAAPAKCGAWQIVKSPNSTFGVSSHLNGVATISSNDLWAVGSSSNQSGFLSQTLAEHWNGSQWSIIPSANPSSAQNILLNAAALSIKDVWAVGDTGNSNGTAFQTLVEQWNGTQWSAISSPNTSLSFNFLNGLAIVSANDIWAVGEGVASGDASSQALIEHW